MHNGPVGKPKEVALPSTANFGLPPNAMFDEEDEDTDVQIVGSTTNKIKVSFVSDVTTTESGQSGQGDKVDTPDVLHCLRLPASLGKQQQIYSLTATSDRSQLLVVTHPKGLNQVDPNAAGGGGYVLVYNTCETTKYTILSDSPKAILEVSSASQAVVSVTLIPSEIGQCFDEEESLSSFLDTSNDTSVSSTSDGALVLTRLDGSVDIVDINDLTCCYATIQPPKQQKFLSVLYCSGKLHLAKS